MCCDIIELRQIIKNANTIVFFGGAGVSTASGIPDFRGSGGLYTGNTGYDEGEADGSGSESSLDEPPETILTADYLYRKSARFFSYYRKNMVYAYAEPNDAHFALAELERRGKLSAVITQNIDGLHQEAGSENVIELHGSTRRNYCVRCGAEHTLAYVMEAEDVPRCKKCGGMVRPDVVLYGENLPWDAFTKAEEMIAAADVLIVGGTSLTVYPAASLVDAFEGEHLIIINQSPTRYDEYAEYVIREPIADVLREMVEEE